MTESGERWKTTRDLTDEIIGAAVEVHRHLGPGLLESTYEECLCRELHLRDIAFQRQVNLPLNYKGLRLEDKHRVDLVIVNRVAIELKAVEILLPVHHAQILTYLRLGGWSVGLLINFHVPVLVAGVHRKAWRHNE
jgi:GxxExxY protein